MSIAVYQYFKQICLATYIVDETEFDVINSLLDLNQLSGFSRITGGVTLTSQLLLMSQSSIILAQ